MNTMEMNTVNATSSTDVKQAISDIRNSIKWRMDDIEDIITDIDEFRDKFGEADMTLRYLQLDLHDALSDLDNAIARIDRDKRVEA